MKLDEGIRLTGWPRTYDDDIDIKVRNTISQEVK
jgi:hypothetical protein